MTKSHTNQGCIFGTSDLGLAISNLVDSKKRLFASIVGIAFCVTLMFVEVGFLYGIYDSQSEVIRLLDADLLLVHRQKPATFPCTPFSHRSTVSARGIPGVASAHSIRIEEYRSVWKNRTDRRAHPVRVLAFDPKAHTFLPNDIQAQQHRLLEPDTALVDALSLDFFGLLAAGERAELSGREVKIVGTFEMGPNFRMDGNVLMSIRTFDRCFPNRDRAEQTVEYATIKLEPGADCFAVSTALSNQLPPDVAVFEKYDYIEHIKRYWRDAMAVGMVFGVGAMLGFVIGATVCYQVLFSGVMGRLPQYATLKALGYTTRHLMRVVVIESLVLATLGFIPGLVSSIGALALLQARTGILVRLTVGRVIPVLCATYGMCLVAGLAASLKLMQADPLELFE